MNAERTQDLTRTVLVVLIIGVLIAGSLWTLLPFIGAIIWAATIVIATWPALESLERAAGGRRSTAVAVMTVIVLLVFIVPFWFAIGTLFDAAAQAVDVVRGYVKSGLGPPPRWISSIPWLGERIANEWRELAAAGPEALVETIRPYARTAAAWMISVTGSLGGTLLHFLLTVIIIGILYAQGETAAKGILAFARRIGGERAEEVTRLAAKSVRSVALGVVVTALVQSALAGLGLWISGVPRPGLLTALAFMLCIAQLGPLLILAPAVIWLYSTGEAGWATVLLIWSVPVIVLDNFLKPVLIRRGVDLPMLLIIAGVIGGIVAFGVIGLFIGPVVLAVTYTLLKNWVSETESPASARR